MHLKLGHIHIIKCKFASENKTGILELIIQRYSYTTHHEKSI